MSRSRTGPSVMSLLEMRSLGTLGFLGVLAFYVAWPLYAGYDLKTSLEGRNVERLNARVDFESVRVSLKPAVTAKVDKVLTQAFKRLGTAGGALADKLKVQMMPRVVDGVLATLVTPEMLIRIHASGRTFKDALDGLVLERASQPPGVMGKGLTIVSRDNSGESRKSLEEIARALGMDPDKALGAADAGVAGDAESAPLAAKGGPRPKYGLNNVKHFSLNGPLGLSVGVARDATARQPDLTADFAFVDGSWKLTGLVPRD